MHSHWVETRSGTKFDLLDPTPAMVSIEDIAWGLSRINRFNGQTELILPYSVADHSLWVAEYLYTLTGSAEVALHGLLHDAHETYTGDITTPIKKLAGVIGIIVALQDRIQQAIHGALNLPLKIPAVVERADNMAMAMEVKLMLPSRGEGWKLVELDQVSGAIPKPRCRAPMQGYKDFIVSYRHLCAEMQRFPDMASWETS
jgi:hypothetical protein